MKEFYKKSIEQSLKETETSFSGLTSKQVEEREKDILKEDFYDEKNGIVNKFFAQFFDLMIIILLLASIISIAIGIMQNTKEEIIDGAVILAIVIMNAIFGVAQEYKAEKSLNALKKLTEQEVFVFRDGTLKKISSNELVIGDIISLEAGIILPADCRIIEGFDLKVDESSLTGESLPVYKDCNFVANKDMPISDMKNMVFKGTSITCGKGKAVVVALGLSTEFGKIAKGVKENSKELTPLQKSIKDVAKVLTFLVLVVAFVTFVIEICISPANIMEAFLTAVAIAVAAIPESMPAVITIIMSMGIARLAKQKAVVKRMHAVETLGCCDVICSDKTGTITQNKMTVTTLYIDGSIQQKNFSKNSTFQKMLNFMLMCNDTNYSKGVYVGDPTEVALSNFCLNEKLYKRDVDSLYPRTRELAFDSGRKLMSVSCKNQSNETMVTKGAVDYLIKKCKYIFLNGQIIELNNKFIQQIEQANKQMSKNALRVIGFAYKELENAKFEENDLIFIGLVGMIDPPRKEIAHAVKKCKKAGMRAIMITGDHKDTALAIAKEIGLAEDEKQVLCGIELDILTDEQLDKKIETINVFARVSPQNKVRIVEALKKKGHIVAMTGDGVNDAPSLKKASIGIGMGKTGTDVAKEVADIIVTDDNFATIVLAVEEGRKIYQNIQKTVKFLFSANMAELLSLFIVTIFFPQYVFLLPVQILFVNLITDSLPAVALGVELPERDLMSRPPRDAKKGLFSDGNGIAIVVLGLVQTLLVVLSYILGLYIWGQYTATTMAFYTLNMIQMFYLASMRTIAPFYKSKPFKNKFFIVAVMFCFVLIGLFAFTPLREIFGLQKLSVGAWSIILGLCFAMLLISEIYKFIEKKVLNKHKK